MNGMKSTRPRRIQRQRVKGWRMPEGAVYVGRGTRWGNPFRVGKTQMHDIRDATAQECVDLYREWVTAPQGMVAEIREHLRGRDLACWCPLDAPCHADVLLDIANEGGVR